MIEIWREIKGYEGLYEVSNHGRIRSLIRKWVKKEVLLVPQPHKQGYLFFGLNRNGKQKRFQAHRLVAIHFIPNPKNLPEVNHVDLNKGNNHVDNLEWTDRVGNTLHALAKGRVFGVKLNYGIANEIRGYYKSGVSQPILAHAFGVGQDQVSRIVNNKVWRTISG